MERNNGVKGSQKIGTLGFKIVKRTFDIVFSVFIGTIALPVILVVMLLIRLETEGGSIYLQERVGCNNKKIRIGKLRSMYIDAEKNGAQWAEKNDPRITKVGQFIRKTRIDELPQLLNVIVGDMSLIGPRPEREVFIREFEKKIPNFRDRLMVKPGISGYAQVNGGYDISPEEKFNLDMKYINEFGFKIDVNIFIATIRVVMFGNGSR